jgi:hypothetical protein
MEVVNNKQTHNQNTNMYSQNDNFADTCNFENRRKPQTSNNNKININNYQGNTQTYKPYSTNYTKKNPRKEIDEDLTTTPSTLQSHYNIILNIDNTTNSLNTITASNKYNEQGNQINLNKKNYNNEDYSTNTLFLTRKEGPLAVPNEQPEGSITDNNIYTNPNFWTNQLPDIKNSQYLFRDIAENNYKDDEGYNEPYVNPYSRRSTNRYNKNSKIATNIEPKVSRNYESNYVLSDGGVVHEGKPRKFKVSYSKNKKYSTDLNEGSISYYNDDVYTRFNNEIGIERKLVRTNDGDGTRYNKFINKNEKDTSLSKHEQNIMLRRNDQILASMNNIMRYD